MPDRPADPPVYTVALTPGVSTHYVGGFYIEVWGAQRSWVDGVELRAVQ